MHNMKARRIDFIVLIAVLLSVFAEAQLMDNCFLEYSGTKIIRMPPYIETSKTGLSPTVTVTIYAADGIYICSAAMIFYS